MIRRDTIDWKLRLAGCMCITLCRPLGRSGGFDLEFYAVSILAASSGDKMLAEKVSELQNP